MSLRAAFALLRRDLALVAGTGGASAPACAFMLAVVTLVPLAVGADRAVLERIGVPLIVIALALAMLLSLERLFQADLEEGMLDQIALGPLPLAVVAAVKALALAFGVGAPLAMLSGLSAILMFASPAAALVIALQSFIAAMAFAALGTIGAALAASVRRSGLLIAILVLPLFAPVVIFAAASGLAATSAAPDGPGEFGEPFWYLCALAMGGLALAPIAAGAALRPDFG